MAVAVGRWLWVGTVPSWCAGHLRGVWAEKVGPGNGRACFQAQRFTGRYLNSQSEEGRQSVKRCPSPANRGVDRRRGGQSPPCPATCGPVSSTTGHRLCLTPGPSPHDLSWKEKATGVICSFEVLSGVFSKNWDFHKEPAMCVLVPKATEYFKIIVSLYLSGYF